MDAAIRELVYRERYGKPLVFKPSSTHSKDEALENLRQSRIAICREVFTKEAAKRGEKGNPFDSLIEEMRKIAKMESQRIVPVVSGEVQQILASVPEISRELGEYRGVEVQEGSIFALLFAPSSDKTLRITASVMMTYLADEDDAFVAMMDCLLDEVKRRVADPGEDFGDAERKEVLNHFKPLLEFLAGRFEMAKDINARLKKLTPSAHRLLIKTLFRAQQKLSRGTSDAAPV
jgi:hypothetical protein